MNRYVPLDVFRGLALAFMILVNTPGSWQYVYPLLQHAKWHGFTPTDLVFSAFLFAVGNSLAFVSAKWTNQTSRAVFTKGLKRAFLIFVIGYLLSWFPFISVTQNSGITFIPVSETRIFGVLQRIGLCYAIALLLIYFLSRRSLICISILILVGYWLLLCGFGDLSLSGNVVLKFDLLVMGGNHLYKGEGIPFDPEGILSSLTAVINIIAGYLVGLKFREKEVDERTLLQVLIVGVLLVFMGFLWSYVFPLNKKLWTSSFVLLTSGLSTLVLSLLVYVMMFSKKRYRFESFNTMGKNPLFLYVLSNVFVVLLDMFGLRRWLYETIFSKLISPWFGSFVFAVLYTTAFWAIAVFMDKRKIYIKIGSRCSK